MTARAACVVLLLWNVREGVYRTMTMNDATSSESSKQASKRLMRTPKNISRQERDQETGQNANATTPVRHYMQPTVASTQRVVHTASRSKSTSPRQTCLHDDDEDDDESTIIHRARSYEEASQQRTPRRHRVSRIPTPTHSKCHQAIIRTPVRRPVTSETIPRDGNDLTEPLLPDNEESTNESSSDGCCSTCWKVCCCCCCCWWKHCCCKSSSVEENQETRVVNQADDS